MNTVIECIIGALVLLSLVGCALILYSDWQSSRPSNERTGNGRNLI